MDPNQYRPVPLDTASGHARQDVFANRNGAELGGPRTTLGLRIKPTIEPGVRRLHRY
jgi:hypothetical protein